jgi:hypothetical protein
MPCLSCRGVEDHSVPPVVTEGEAGHGVQAAGKGPEEGYPCHVAYRADQ